MLMYSLPYNHTSLGFLVCTSTIFYSGIPVINSARNSCAFFHFAHCQVEEGGEANCLEVPFRIQRSSALDEKYPLFSHHF